MAGYSSHEHADMIFTCDQANGNRRVAARLYNIAFTEQRQPSHLTFADVYSRVTKTGLTLSQTIDRGRRRYARKPGQVEYILYEVIPVSANVKWSSPVVHLIALHEK